MSAALQPRHAVVRVLEEKDLDQVYAVECAAYPFPWTREIFSECLRVGYVCRGMFLGPELIGYLVLAVAAGEAHLLNLCIHPLHQGSGFGSKLLECAIDCARQRGGQSMFLEVRPSNLGAARLYQRRGFREIGRRPAYYRAADGREDALVMQLELGA